jgi:hypothetical protein
MEKHWITLAKSWFEASREPLAHETNELDWKIAQSDN